MDLQQKLKRIGELNEDQIMELKAEFKKQEIPNWRLYNIIGYNIFVSGLGVVYGINYRKLSKKYIKPKKYSMGQAIKYATYQAIPFTICYVIGFYIISGFWNPITYLKQLAQIDGKVIDTYIKFDPFCQEQFLFNNMKYFGLSQTLIDQAQKELQDQENQHDQFWTKQEQKGLFKVFVNSKKQLIKEKIQQEELSQLKSNQDLDYKTQILLKENDDDI